MTDSPLRLYNSLTRRLETFTPIHPGAARVYSCGPTVYNYPHIGNMRAYVFADVLGRALRSKGYELTHVINITDVGHLTDDGDAGEDKLEKAAVGGSARDIARHYTEAYWADFRALNCREPAHWTVATAYVPQMIEFAKRIAEKHCYELPSGLYFDTSTVPDYGRLARAATGEGESRIDPVDGKRNAADFAIWRRTPPGETRQMEWDSPWGRGAPGWHLECSVMSGEVLGFPFDIHTGGIDHREIHHPNEIAQNQAHCGSADPGAAIWMHNNFLVDRTGKMSKSAGEFLRLQTLIDRGYHPLAYRMMCLQAHYRSELEFTWEGLGAALTRLKRMVMGTSKFLSRENYSASFDQGAKPAFRREILNGIDQALSDDLNTPMALTIVERLLLPSSSIEPFERWGVVKELDQIFGLRLFDLVRADLRIRPKSATITETEIEAQLVRRKEARSARDFATSDAIRDELAARGVEVMDGDPLEWEWKLS
ncbi:cysteine--tRNA ligase [Qipengyuania sediminis]|uniref:cysteine--tRNA ligase n=1 Tax=Qipengyuania sediminis TaxID=1532023 RepID=UPI001059E9AC|nr:cysteine--tRNA ligase [Qipengyuania sediminis]